MKSPMIQTLSLVCWTIRANGVAEIFRTEKRKADAAYANKVITKAMTTEINADGGSNESALNPAEIDPVEVEIDPVEVEIDPETHAIPIREEVQADGMKQGSGCQGSSMVTQFTAERNSRTCKPKGRMGNWNNFGPTSQGECLRKCQCDTVCQFVEYRAEDQTCTGFTACWERSLAGKSVDTWKKQMVTPSPTNPTPAPPDICRDYWALPECNDVADVINGLADGVCRAPKKQIVPDACGFRELIPGKDGRPGGGMRGIESWFYAETALCPPGYRADVRHDLDPRFPCCEQDVNGIPISTPPSCPNGFPRFTKAVWADMRLPPDDASLLELFNSSTRESWGGRTQQILDSLRISVGSGENALLKLMVLDSTSPRPYFVLIDPPQPDQAKVGWPGKTGLNTRECESSCENRSEPLKCKLNSGCSGCDECRNLVPTPVPTLGQPTPTPTAGPSEALAKFPIVLQGKTCHGSMHQAWSGPSSKDETECAKDCLATTGCRSFTFYLFRGQPGCRLFRWDHTKQSWCTSRKQDGATYFKAGWPADVDPSRMSLGSPHETKETYSPGDTTDLADLVDKCRSKARGKWGGFAWRQSDGSGLCASFGSCQGGAGSSDCRGPTSAEWDNAAPSDCGEYPGASGDRCGVVFGTIFNDGPGATNGQIQEWEAARILEAPAYPLRPEFATPATPAPPPPNADWERCVEDRLVGQFVLEGHGNTAECYDFFIAQEKCIEASDCYAIAAQRNICDGKFRVTHGGPTIIDYIFWPKRKYLGDFNDYEMVVYKLDRDCLSR